MELTEQNAPNGVEDFLQVHFEIAIYLAETSFKDDKSIASQIESVYGYGGLYDFAKQMTIMYENQHIGFVYDADWHEELSKFFKFMEKLNVEDLKLQG